MKLKSINVFRRKLTKFITGSVGNPLKSLSDLDRIKDVNSIKKILIIRTNHRLGNILLITPLVQEVQEIFPNARVSFFVKGGVTPVLFQNYDRIDNYLLLPKKHFKELLSYLKTWFKLLFKKYDLVINVESGSSSGKLATKFSKSSYKFYGNEFDNLISFSTDQVHFAKLPVYKLRKYVFENQDFNKPIPQLNIKLNTTELASGKKLVDALVPDNSKKTIAIFTFATGSKCYSKQWWNEFYEALNTQFSKYNLIEILPVENVSQIDFKLPTFYSKDLREIASFIENIDVFIGADSGMMHLAAATSTTVFGLFSITAIEKYGSYGTKKYAINTNTTSINLIIEAIKESQNQA